MKGEIKKKYQDFVSHIDFPMLIYIYENNNIIAINDSAVKIIGDSYTDIRYLFEGKKFKFSKDTLDNGCDLFLNTKIYLNSKVDYIDMDVCIMQVDNLHLVYVIFEESYKNLFLSDLRIQTPRLIYKYSDCDKYKSSTILKNDLENSNNKHIDFNNEEIDSLFDKIESNNTDSKDNQYNMIKMLGKNGDFIKLQIMPILDKKDKCIGTLGVYNHIVSKEKQKQIYAGAMKNSSLITTMMDEGDTVFVGWFNDENTNIQYVSPNISLYGYDENDFYDGKVSFKDMVYDKDFDMVKDKFKPKSRIEDDEKRIYEYRIKKKNGDLVWVHEECIPVIVRNNIVYNFSSIKDITKEKNDKVRVIIDSMEERAETNENDVKLSSICDNLKTIFDAFESMILIINVDDYIIKYANKKVVSNHLHGEGYDIFEFLKINSLEEKSDSINELESIIPTIHHSEFTSLSNVIKYAFKKQEKKALIYNIKENIYLTVKAKQLDLFDDKKEVVVIFDEINK